MSDIAKTERASSAAIKEAAGEHMYDAGGETNAPDIFDHNVPSQMESEVFDKHHMRAPLRTAVDQEPDGCWSWFKQGVRSIWQTKHMNTFDDRENLIATTLRELAIYLIFLATTCIIAFGMTSASMYYFTATMQRLFIDTTTPRFSDSMMIFDDFWNLFSGNDTIDITHHGLLDSLHMEQWYDGSDVTLKESGFVYYENKLLGLPRLRQLKVTNTSCTVPSQFNNIIEKCYDVYSSADEDTKPFGPLLLSYGEQNCLKDNNGVPVCTAWKYTNAADMGAMSYTGLVTTYGAGGFYQLLGHNRTESDMIMAHLLTNRWITRGTRVVFIDFTLYNANINLFCFIKMVIEMPPVGGVITSSSLRTVKLIRYVSNFDYFVLACEALFCCFMIYYTIEEAIEIFKWRFAYFTEFWNVLDVLLLGLGYTSIGFSAYRQIVIDQSLDSLLSSLDTYANFEYLSWAQSSFNDISAVLLFFVWIKVFKYISFNKTMTQLSSTLSRSAKDVAGFSVMFFIVFGAYAQLGFLLFGDKDPDYQSFYKSVFTLLRLILCDFDYLTLTLCSPVLGPIYFISYVLLCFFVLLNMFLAIINETYKAVKDELEFSKNEFEISDVFKRSYYNMLRKLNLKKDRLVDIRSVLKIDERPFKPIPYEEWRTQLKKRGYADQEIHSLFVNHNLNGDGVLDKGEAKRMLSELQGLSEPDMVLAETMHARMMAAQPAYNSIPVNDFNVVARRVNRVEQSLTSIILRIDTAVDKLENIDRLKMQHCERLAKIIIDVNNSNLPDKEKRMKMDAMIQEEMARFDQDNGSA